MIIVLFYFHIFITCISEESLSSDWSKFVAIIVLQYPRPWKMGAPFRHFDLYVFL